MNRNAALDWIARNVHGLALSRGQSDDVWRFKSADGQCQIRIGVFASGAKSVNKVFIGVTEDDGATYFQINFYPLRKQGDKLEAVLNCNGGIKTRTEINARSALRRTQEVATLIAG